MPKARPRAVRQYSDEFKLTAVRLSQQPGLQVKTVATALEIHPFMLSKWRGDFRAAPGPREGLRPAARGARTPKKRHPVLFRSKADIFAFIETPCAGVSVASLCRRYQVTRAGFDAARRRGKSAHHQQNQELARALLRVFRAHQGRYGSPRICQVLQAEGWTVSRRRIAQLMHAAGLRARAVRGYRAKAKIHQLYARHPNRLWDLSVTRVNQVWVGDITFLNVDRGGGIWPSSWINIPGASWAGPSRHAGRQPSCVTR